MNENRCGGGGLIHIGPDKVSIGETTRAYNARAVKFYPKLLAMVELFKKELNHGFNSLDTKESAEKLEAKIDALIEEIKQAQD